VLARARFAEDHLEGAVRRGVRQYIVLGAGFDSFAVRMPAWARTLRVFELDRPETLAEKRRRLERAGLGCPDNLEFVPVDFERESLDEVLGRSSFTPAAPSFFSWLGVVVYLTSESIDATLKSIESVTPPGSELVFDYMLPDHLVESRERGVIDYVRRVGMRRGEPYVTLGPGRHRTSSMPEGNRPLIGPFSLPPAGTMLNGADEQARSSGPTHVPGRNAAQEAAADDEPQRVPFDLW
jgi:methyltransferase (TIGR00027 family)